MTSLVDNIRLKKFTLWFRCDRKKRKILNKGSKLIDKDLDIVRFLIKTRILWALFKEENTKLDYMRRRKSSAFILNRKKDLSEDSFSSDEHSNPLTDHHEANHTIK